MLLAGAKWSSFHRWLAHIPEADVPGHGRVESYIKIAQLKPPTSRKVLAENIDDCCCCLQIVVAEAEQLDEKWPERYAYFLAWRLYEARVYFRQKVG